MTWRYFYVLIKEVIIRKKKRQRQVNKRTIARELALLTFSQLGKEIEKQDSYNILDIIEQSVDTLTKEAESNLQSSVRELSKIREFIQNYEIDHADNLERPIEALIIPVAIPMTSDMTGRIDSLMEAAEKIYAAMDIVSVASYSKRDEVKDYCTKLVKTFASHKDAVDEMIKKHSIDWDINRLLKIDRDILRISITELLFMQEDNVPDAVSINEAVELAKKYGSEESSSFINGILRQVFEEKKGIKHLK